LTSPPWPETLYPPIDFEKAVAWCEQRTGKTLAPSQSEALKTVLTNRVVIMLSTAIYDYSWTLAVGWLDTRATRARAAALFSFSTSQLLPG
jgi:hypothetical protein